MASRILTPSLRAVSRSAAPLPIRTSRTFQTSSRRMDTATTVAVPVRKPVGAFRGGLVGFLLGATAAGTLVYTYILDEYKVSNELLTEDIYVRQCI
ncbi:hypothetical protein MMC11_000869 [Xylographa trunciseda]|nr:hypothetical protein [Xylographa trunciseda]